MSVVTRVTGPGQDFATSARTVTAADIDAFAALTGDQHPQHTDAEWARTTRFGERVAHGLLVLSYAAGLIGFDPARVVALRGVRDVVFKRAVKIGDSMRVEGEAAGARQLDAEYALVDVRIRVLNQHDQLVMRATLAIVWREGARA